MPTSVELAEGGIETHESALTGLNERGRVERRRLVGAIIARLPHDSCLFETDRTDTYRLLWLPTSLALCGGRSTRRVYSSDQSEYAAKSIHSMLR